MNTVVWMEGLVFGSIGLGYFVYGRRQRRVAPLITGLALMAFPYAVTNPYALVGIGVALMSVPYFVRL